MLCACACYADTLSSVVFFFVIVLHGCALGIQIISETKHCQIISETKNLGRTDRQTGGQTCRQAGVGIEMLLI